MNEQTLVLIKPDAVARGLTGTILTLLEQKGLRFCRMELRQISRELATHHYQEHQGKDFFEDLVTFICSGPLVAMVLEGPEAIGAVRTLAGATDPLKAEPGSIRSRFACSVRANVLHASDSPQSALREIALFFPPDTGHA